jgi:NodT family efflux transporter outer membrane factor (OMF) lipoprotein
MLLPALLGLHLAACSWLDVSRDHPQPATPASWHAAPTAEPAPAPVVPWLDALDDPKLAELAAIAERSNHELAEQRAVVAQAREALRATGAARYPNVQLALDTAERQAGVDFARSASSASVQLQASFELDIWGRLSDLERGALLAFEEQQVRYEALRIEVLAALASDWYSLMEADQLVTLLEGRVRNLQQNLAVIEDGYRLGLSESLDVYLARNQLEQEQANLQARLQGRDDTRRSLELTLGAYPAASVAAEQALPALEAPPATGVPAELAARRPDIRAAWLALLNADSAVAAARKARFPRLSLTADVGRSALELTKLASDSVLIWSLAGGLTQPLFDAGRLAAEEAQARAQVVALEQRYLRTVFLAFGEVERAISQEHSLTDRLRAVEQARTNATVAEELAFDQYRRGVVPYATVLEVQRRSFDAATEFIALRAELLRNRVALHAALGSPPQGS